MPALVAVTAPSVISYLRLKPHNWSSSYTWLGDQNREASLRICRPSSMTGKDPAKGYNLEYRAADATACPHLALAMILRAGLQGIREQLPAPPIFSGDPETVSEDERIRLRLKRLPLLLAEALAEFEKDEVAAQVFNPQAFATYVGMKRQEIAMTAGESDKDLCRRYAQFF